jgi:spermidine/putrescine transport system ATP-binding protein
MVLEPTLLLLDEPLGALDLKLREHMKIELKQLQASFGTTFVYITHDQSEALVLSDHVAVMNRGRFEQIGTPQELYYQPATAFVAAFVGANNRIAGRLTRREDELAELTTEQGWVVRARHSGSCSVGDSAAVFIRPEVVSLERAAEQLPSDHLRFGGTVQSLLFDGANSAVLLNEERSGFEFRVALPQTGRFADLKVGEHVFFGFDPRRAICFAGSVAPGHG